MSQNEKPSLEELRAQAMAHAQVAREVIGQDTLNRLSQIMAKQQETAAMQRAKVQIQSHSLEDLTRELRYLIEN